MIEVHKLYLRKHDININPFNLCLQIGAGMDESSNYNIEYLEVYTVMTGKKDRTQYSPEISNKKNQYKRITYITNSMNRDMCNFYKTIKNIKITK